MTAIVFFFMFVISNLHIVFSFKERPTSTSVKKPDLVPSLMQCFRNPCVLPTVAARGTQRAHGPTMPYALRFTAASVFS